MCQFSFLSLPRDETTGVHRYAWLSLAYFLLSELMPLNVGRGEMTYVYMVQTLTWAMRTNACLEHHPWATQRGWAL